MARLPQPGGDSGNWGTILNDYLSQSHDPDGLLKANTVGASQIMPGAVTKADVGLGNVDNTSDADKPVSTAVQTALNAKSNTADVVASADLDAETAALIGSTSSDTRAALNDRYALQKAALLYDPSTKSNGQLAPAFTADTGQPMTAFVHSTGQAPLVVSGGTITHTPTGVSGSAGYLQADLGGRVRRLGAMVSWPTSALGIVTLTIPSASWAPNTLPNAGFHLAVNGNGIWTLTRYTTGGSTTLATYQTHGRFDSLTWGTGFKPLEVWLDPDNQKAVITWPDGTTSTITSPYFASETSNYAIWELFESGGASDVSASFGKLWADTAPTTPDITALTNYRMPGRNAPVNLSASGALSLNIANGPLQLITLTGNVTSLAFTNPQYMGQEIEIHLIQDGAGNRTLAGVNSSIKWAGGTAPTLSTTLNRRDIFRFRYYGTLYYETSRSMNVG